MLARDAAGTRLALPVTLSLVGHVAAGALLLAFRPAPRPSLPPTYRVSIVAAPPGPRAAGVVRPPDPQPPAERPAAPPPRAESPAVAMPATAAAARTPAPPATPAPAPRGYPGGHWAH